MAETISPLVPVIATSFVGLIACFIAYQQWKLANNKLKYDLFERRYKIYDQFIAFIEAVCRNPEFDIEHLTEFKKISSDVAFLFGPEIEEYRRELMVRSLGIRKFTQQTNLRLYDGPITEEKARKYYTEISWVSDQMRDAKSKFNRYLSFSEINGTSFLDRMEKVATKHDGPIY